MERQQGIVYQLDLFDQTSPEAIRPSHTRDTVSEADDRKELQVKGAGERKRALAMHLMQVVCSHDNIKRAYKQVKQNKGVAGVDNMAVYEFAEWFAIGGANLLEALQTGNYQPQAVKFAEILKPDGGIRKLGIPKLLSYYFITVSCRNRFPCTNIR